MQSRNLKIESTGDYFAGKVKPQIRLKGYWLEHAGFKPGHYVAVYIIWPGLIALRFVEKPESCLYTQFDSRQKRNPADQIRTIARL